MISKGHIDQVLTSDYLFAQDFNGVKVVTHSPLVSAGVGAPPFSEEPGGRLLLMNTAGRNIYTWTTLHHNWDVRHNINFYVWWTSEAASIGDRTIDWKVFYSQIDSGDGISATLSGTPLDTPIPQAAPLGTASTINVEIQRTLAGVLNGDSLTYKPFLRLIVEMDAFDAAFTENKGLFALEIEYSPRGGRRHRKVARAR